MTAIASTKASVDAGASQEGPAGAAEGSRSALSDLVGTDTTGGRLQVTGVNEGGGGFLAAVVLKAWRPRVSVVRIIFLSETNPGVQVVQAQIG